MQPFSYKAIQRGVRKLSLFLVVALVVCLGFKNILEPQNSAAKESRSANFVTVTANTWSDSFDDMSGLSDLMDAQISDGKLTLANDALLGSATSILIAPPLEVQSWGRLYFTVSTPLSTALTIDVLDAADVLLMHNVPNGGSLAGIDAEMYPVLKLRAMLSSTVIGQTPSLDEWNLTWTPEYPYQIYLPIAGKFFNTSDSPLPLQGATIGFTGANGQNPPGKTVRFPSTRKNALWISSFAIQNITNFATTLTLEFFREDGVTAYTVNGIPLRPYGTYIASLSDFPLVDGSYALAVTATEPIVGMANTRHAVGKMAVAYNGVSQGGKQIIVPRVFKNYSGWTSGLCIHNMTPEDATNVEIHYIQQDGTVYLSRLIDIPGNGVNCIDMGKDEPWLPSFYGGAVLITSDTNLAVTVEDINLQHNYAMGYLGFDSSVGSDTIYIPRAQIENNWQTNILVCNIGISVTEPITATYHESDGTFTYSGGLTSFPCPGSPTGNIIPPPSPPSSDRLGSIVVSADQGELIALVTDKNTPPGTDMFSYPGLPISSTTAYVPNVGAGFDNWSSTLNIQNPNAITNTVTASFYNRTGELVHELQEDLAPYGMGPYEVAQLPGLSAAYEGSVIISATSPVAVLASKASSP